MGRFSKDHIEQLYESRNQCPTKARNLLLAYEQEYAEDAYFQQNRGALYIDIGAAVPDAVLINKGIQSIKQLLSVTTDQKTVAQQLYNLGNGYLALHFDVERYQPGFSFDPDATPLLQAKRYYRKALKLSHLLGNDWQAQLRVNYANCLSGLGRSLEAISEYKTALAYQPDHPVAWGNLGIELEYFASIAGNLLTLQYAHKALGEALANEHLEQMGRPSERATFERAFRRIDQRLSRANVSDTLLSESMSSRFSSAQHKAYVEFCMNHQLFLNFCLDAQPCPQIIGDSVMLSLITNIGDNTTFPRLARVANEIKERYATARLLVFEAMDHPYETLPYDEMTKYVDNLDYAVYGVRAAKLKIAFETAYNILDKIGFFINKYLYLGIEDSRVGFSTIWREKQEKEIATLRPSIAQLNNYHLYGLYDISLDLAPRGYLEKLRHIRNSLTHRYLVLHTEDSQWLTNADGMEYHLGYREFLEYTIKLMQLVRSAVIYLIAFIDQEEQDKQQEENGLIGSMLVLPYRYHSWGPMDSPT